MQGLAAARHGAADQPADAQGFFVDFAVTVRVRAGVGGGLIVKGQRCRHTRSCRAVFAALDGAVLHRAGGNAAQGTHRAHVFAVALGFGIHNGKGFAAHGVGACGFCRQVDQHVRVCQRQVLDGAAVFCHQADVAAAVLGNRVAAQLQACDGVAVAVQRHFLFQRQQAGPRHGCVRCRGLGGGGCTLGTIDDGRTAEPVDILGQLGGQGAIARIPAQVVQVAEALQISRRIGVQRVFGVGVGALADGVGGHTFGAGRCGDFGIDVGGILHKAGDAEKLGLVNVSTAHSVVACLQDGGIVHSIQRQHKAAVGIPQREGVVSFDFAAVFAIQGHRQGLLGFGDGGQGHQHREQLFVVGFAANIHRVLGVGFVAFGGAAPSQVQRFAVDQPLVAHAQLALLQIDHVDRIVGAVVAHQRPVAAVLVAAVVQQGGVGLPLVVGKAQRLHARIIKDREHLPGAGVNFNAESSIQKGAVVDILLYVGIQLALGRVFCRLCALVKVQRVDAGVQGFALVLRHRFGKGLRNMPAVTVRRHLRGEVVLLPCQLQLRRGQLRGLEHSAGV